MCRHEEQKPTKSRKGRIGACAVKIGQEMMTLSLREVSRIVRIVSHYIVESRKKIIRLFKPSTMLIDKRLIYLMRFPFAIDKGHLQFSISW